jgi:hypothetical protein
LASWLLGFLASWLLGFLASWLLGFLATKIVHTLDRGSTALPRIAKSRNSFHIALSR